MELRSGRRLHFSRQQLGQPGGGGGGGPDLISALPDDLLLLVLARLPCAGAAARTGVLSRRWRGLWAELRRIVFRGVAVDSIEPALGRVSPAISLLEIHIPASARCWSTDVVDTSRVNSLLRAATRLEPEVLFFDLSSALISDSSVVILLCFHRATSMPLGLFANIHVLAGVEFPALETMYLGCCIDALDSLLSSCPRLRTLHLSGTVLNEPYLRVNSASLLELVVDSKRTHSVNIVAPLLKQLTMSFNASKISIISVLAPMVEKVSWKCCYMYGYITDGRETRTAPLAAHSCPLRASPLLLNLQIIIVHASPQTGDPKLFP